MTRHNIACCLQEMGQPDEARRLMRDNYAATAALRNPEASATYAEDYSAVLADLRDFRSALVLLAAAQAMRTGAASKPHPYQQRVIDDAAARSKAALGDAWVDAWRAGESLSIEQAVRQVDAAGARAAFH